jgi:hypothetical protein
MAVDINKVQEIYASYFTGGGKRSGLDAKTIKLILDTYETEKLGPDQIVKFLKKKHNKDIGRSTISRILTTGRNQNIIKPIALKDFKFFEESRRTEPRFNSIREITNIDRTRNPDIPAGAKFKVEFGRPNLDVKTTAIPEEFIGLKYFNTREEAETALDKRKNTSFKTPAGDPEEVSYKRNKRRYENVKAVTKGASELDKQNIKKIQGGITEINNYFKNSPELINTTPFGQNVKAMMAIRLDKDTGNFFSRLKSDDYYLQKAKDGRLFDLFDVSPVAKRKRGGRYPTNVNITPNQFNRAFVQSQLTNFFNKGVNEETAAQLDGILKERNIRVELPNVGRVGAAADVAFDSTTGSFPRIIKTLESMEAPEEIKNLFRSVAELKPGSKSFRAVCTNLKASGGTVDSCLEIIAKDPEAAANKFKNLDVESGPLAKVKNAATNFLQRPFVKGAGKFGALAAVGAAGAGAVKAFMNDDPTTYLSNEEQQKNLLIDMVTGSLDDTPQESPAILDYQLPAIGGAAVAGTAAVAPSTIEAARSGALGSTKSGITKTALKTLGRGLATLGTPAGLLATEPLFLAGQIQQGDSLGEIATNPMNYLGAAFAGPVTEFATKGLNPAIAKTMRLGISPSVLKTVSRRFGLPGLALSAGISGYEMFDDYRNKRGMFSEE